MRPLTQSRVTPAKDLIGSPVHDRDGARLGRLIDFAIDLAPVRIGYAVLSFGGFLGFGSKLFAIPWNALTLDAREERFVLNVSKEKLENAEGFDKDNWPDLNETGYRSQVYALYNVKPDWM